MSPREEWNETAGCFPGRGRGSNMVELLLPKTEVASGLRVPTCSHKARCLCRRSMNSFFQKGAAWGSKSQVASPHIDSSRSEVAEVIAERDWIRSTLHLDGVFVYSFSFRGSARRTPGVKTSKKDAVGPSLPLRDRVVGVSGPSKLQSHRFKMFQEIKND